MEEGEWVFGSIYEEGGEMDMDDDVEEGELVEGEEEALKSLAALDVTGCNGGENVGNQEGENPNRKRNKKKKKRNKKKSGGPGPNVTNIHSFVLNVCRRLREKKSYMVYTAAGCLGISALSNLVQEVDAIQSCGGQMTTDGRRCRTGGGILWNIIKAREPMAYKEIMKKAKEFEKQFRQQLPGRRKEVASKEAVPDETSPDVPDGTHLAHQNLHEQSIGEGKHRSVHDRLRMPVSYDDLLGDDPKNDYT